MLYSQNKLQILTLKAFSLLRRVFRLYNVVHWKSLFKKAFKILHKAIFVKLLTTTYKPTINIEVAQNLFILKFSYANGQC